MPRTWSWADPPSSAAHRQIRVTVVEAAAAMLRERAAEAVRTRRVAQAVAVQAPSSTACSEKETACWTRSANTSSRVTRFRNVCGAGLQCRR
ncbi:MAG: hypothetical protein JWM76_1839 [Pseudonocardiales bacterium]|nr:hypothetical protein [Pseudonocardiales bacterium]